MEHSLDSFDFISKQDWTKQLEKDLRGISFEDLTSIDENGLKVDPFYTEEDLPKHIQPLFHHTDWGIAAKIEVTSDNEHHANLTALEALGNGVSTIYWHFKDTSNIDWSKLFDQIQLDIIHSFIISDKASPFPKKLKELLIQKFDYQEQNPFLFWLYDEIFQELVGQASSIKIEPQHIYIQGNEYSHLGLNATQQIAYILLQLQEYLHYAIQENQLSNIQTIHIGIAQNTHFFQEIAKLRALRILTQVIIQEYNIIPTIYFHASTSLSYLTAEDNPNNILRNTVAGMSSVLGGCDFLYIHPHKNAAIQADIDAVRIARNQQHLFKEESYLNKIADASYGSYTIESRTQDIAHQSWKMFLELEEKGGIKLLGTSFIKEVENAQLALLKAYQNGQLNLIGYNKYLLEEKNVLPVFEVKTWANGLKYFQLPLLKNKVQNA